jgi:prepilin-type N-terminal cleavage/methylation domain-containing protein
MKRGRGSDRGVTLLELLITMALMSLAFAAVLGGMGVFLRAASTQRSVASLDAGIRTYAEALMVAPYTNCADSVTYEGAMRGVLAQISRDADADVAATVAVAYWDGNIPAVFGAQCATDLGVQQLTIRLRAADGVTADLVVGKSR